MNQMIEDSGILMFVGSQWSKFWLISTYPQGPRRYLSNSSTLCAGKEATRQAWHKPKPFAQRRRFLAVWEKNYKSYMNMISSAIR